MSGDRDIIENDLKAELKVIFPTEYPAALPFVNDARSKFDGGVLWNKLQLNEETDTQFEENFYELSEGQKLYYLPALLGKAFDADEHKQYRLDFLLGRDRRSPLSQLSPVQLRWIARQSMYFGGRPSSESVFSLLSDLLGVDDETKLLRSIEDLLIQR